jgi:pantoate--beta-alanine ligase
MGALHAGHVALVARARSEARRVVVSIFVNPTQFAPHEDFARYPRTLEADTAKLSAAGVDLIYAPAAQDIYPEGFATHVVPAGAAEGLESTTRPHFFAGVATVVAKLFTRVTPDVAIFGEKDFQQLRVVAQMARDLDLGVRVLGEPIVREADGLALSSRNAYLDPAQRAAAPALFAALQEAAQAIAGGTPAGQALEATRARLTAAGLKVDYVALRDAETLGAPVPGRPARLLAAASLGTTRLIDNVAVPG